MWRALLWNQLRLCKSDSLWKIISKRLLILCYTQKLVKSNQLLEKDKPLYANTFCKGSLLMQILCLSFIWMQTASALQAMPSLCSSVLRGSSASQLPFRVWNRFPESQSQEKFTEGNRKQASVVGFLGSLLHSWGERETNPRMNSGIYFWRGLTLCGGFFFF